MRHEMKLWDAPFQAMKSKSKTLEMRLFDEKRSQIQAGDLIEFQNADTGERLLCEVKELFRYPSFDKLYQNHDKISIGYTENEIADPKDMMAYYSKEKIDRYGVVAIEVRVKD